MSLTFHSARVISLAVPTFLALAIGAGCEPVGGETGSSAESALYRERLVVRLADGNQWTYNPGRARLEANDRVHVINENSYYEFDVWSAGDLVMGFYYGSGEPLARQTAIQGDGTNLAEEVPTSGFSDDIPGWTYLIARDIRPGTYYLVNRGGDDIASMYMRDPLAPQTSVEGKYVIESYGIGRNQRIPLGTPFELRRVACPYYENGMACYCAEMKFSKTPKLLSSVELRTGKVVLESQSRTILEDGRTRRIGANYLGDINQKEVLIQLSTRGICVTYRDRRQQCFDYVVTRTGDL